MRVFAGEGVKGRAGEKECECRRRAQGTGHRAQGTEHRAQNTGHRSALN